MVSGREKLAALVESDLEVLAELVGMYSTAYYGGAVTALINAPSGLPGAPLSEMRCHVAVTIAQQFLKGIQDDPAVALSLSEGILATLRGEDPDPTVIESHASRASR